MRTRDFHYDLPEELIAQFPVSQRDASRLLHVAKGGELTDAGFKDLLDILCPGDLLVLNDTRVIPARLFACKDTGGKVEIMLERVIDDTSLLVQLRASKSPRAGSLLQVAGGDAFQVVGRQEDMYLLKFIAQGGLDEFLQQHGHIPLPPYIQRADDAQDQERYQTVYSDKPGAVAAPTAGLHFTEDILAALKKKDVDHVRLTLHVGAGTFQPVRVDDVSNHKMHKERMVLTADTVNRINTARAKGGRIIAVGTTVVRSLETAARSGELQPYEGDTDIFIYPGFKFNVIDMLLTNFHLPESTLLMLVSAFAGKDTIMRAYNHAVQQRYRFFSYGDAMLLERDDDAV